MRIPYGKEWIVFNWFRGMSMPLKFSMVEGRRMPIGTRLIMRTVLVCVKRLDQTYTRQQKRNCMGCAFLVV